MNTSTITVADSNAFMADLRGAAYAAKHDPKIIAELKELSRRLARAGETVMHAVQRIPHRRQWPVSPSQPVKPQLPLL
jgi:hypothetical protein